MGDELQTMRLDRRRTLSRKDRRARKAQRCTGHIRGLLQVGGERREEECPGEEGRRSNRNKVSFA